MIFFSIASPDSIVFRWVRGGGGIKFEQIKVRRYGGDQGQIIKFRQGEHLERGGGFNKYLF